MKNWVCEFLESDILNWFLKKIEEEAAKAIDQEVRDILEHNYERAKQIIVENRERMVNLANALMEVETMDRETFEALMNAPQSTENGSVDAIDLVEKTTTGD